MRLPSVPVEDRGDSVGARLAHGAAIVVALLLVLATPPGAGAQPALGDAPLRESFAAFEGTGWAPAPAAGQLDSDAWIVTGVAAGDLSFGDAADGGAYARGATAAMAGAPGVWAFDVEPGDRALGALPSMGELSPGAFVTRFTNGTGADLVSFTLSYECWHWNGGGSANDLGVEIITGASAETLGELACTGRPMADADPGWVGATRSTVYTPSAPIAPDAMVEVRFFWEVRGTGSAFDQLAIDDVVLGLAGQCGNGVVEAGDGCDDGDPCTSDTCIEPGGCVFEPNGTCAPDGGQPPPARYDAGAPPNGFVVPDLGRSDGPAPDGCDCGAHGGASVPAGLWPLGLALLGLRRRVG